MINVDAKQLNFDPSAEVFSSPDLSVWVEERLGDIVGLLEEHGMRGYDKQGKCAYLYNVYTGSDLPELLPEARADSARHRQEGGITSLNVRKDTESGRVVYAKINGDFPQSISDKKDFVAYIADTWHAQFFLKHDEDGSNRVVVDTWRLPLTELERFRKDQGGRLDGEALAIYNAMHSSMFRNRDGSGIPIGAVDRRHDVYGREGEIFTDIEFDQVADLLDIMFDGANEAIAYHQSRGHIPEKP